MIYHSNELVLVVRFNDSYIVHDIVCIWLHYHSTRLSFISKRSLEHNLLFDVCLLSPHLRTTSNQQHTTHTCTHKHTHTLTLLGETYEILFTYLTECKHILEQEVETLYDGCVTDKHLLHVYWKAHTLRVA